MKEPNLSKRVNLVLEAVFKGKLPLNSWSLDYYRQFNSKDKRQGPGKKKEGLFPDHIPFFLDGDSIRMVELFEDHMELRAGGYRQFREKAGRSPDSCSRFVKKFGDERLFCLKFDQRVRPEDVQRLLLPGVWVGGHQYNFLGCSQAGLKERTALLWRGSTRDVADVLASCGDFHKIATVSKRMAREGLLFSSVQMSGVHVEKEDIIKGEDIEDGEFCFSDGCGEISDEMLTRVMDTFPNSLPSGYLPSVVQLRLQGIKGVVARNPGLDTGKLMIRPSQTKFETDFDSCLAVAGTSRPYTFAHLNKQFVILLSGLGIPDSVFVCLHEEFFGMVETMLQDKEAAITILQWRNQWEVAQHLAKMSALKFSSLSRCRNPNEMYRDTDSGAEVMKKLAEVQEKILTSNKKEKDGIEKDKLRVLVRKSRLLYGVCDQNGDLQYGQCQVKPDSNQSKPISLDQVRITTEGGLVKSLKGKAVVARSPSYLLGDIRVLEMVHVPGLEHLGGSS